MMFLLQDHYIMAFPCLFYSPKIFQKFIFDSCLISITTPIINSHYAMLPLHYYQFEDANINFFQHNGLIKQLPITILHRFYRNKPQSILIEFITMYNHHLHQQWAHAARSTRTTPKTQQQPCDLNPTTTPPNDQNDQETAINTYINAITTTTQLLPQLLQLPYNTLLSKLCPSAVTESDPITFDIVFSTNNDNDDNNKNNKTTTKSIPFSLITATHHPQHGLYRDVFTLARCESSSTVVEFQHQFIKSLKWFTFFHSKSPLYPLITTLTSLLSILESKNELNDQFDDTFDSKLDVLIDNGIDLTIFDQYHQIILPNQFLKNLD